MLLPVMTVLLVLAPAAAADREETKGKNVAFELYDHYFQKNNAGLKGEASHLVLTSPKSFDKVFGVGFTMGPKPHLLPKNAFSARVVLAVIKRGTSLYAFKVQKVTDDNGTLTVRYEAAPQPGGGTARYASPLILSVPKGNYKSVVFVENGKKVATEKVEK